MKNNNKLYLTKLNNYLSEVYNVADKNFCRMFSKKFNINETSALLISRRVLPILIHLFFDKLIKINSKNKTVKEFKKIKIFNLKVNINRVQELESFLMQPFLHTELEKILNNYLYHEKLNKEIYSLNNEKGIAYKNNLYVIKNYILYKFFFKLENFFLKSLPFLGRLPSLHLSQLSSAFYKKGLFIKFFKNIDYEFTTIDNKNNLLNREVFFQKILPIHCFEKFITIFEINVSSPHLLNNLFHQFLQTLFPKIFFEDFIINFDKALDILEKSSKKIILTSGSFSTSNVFLLSAAKEYDYKIIKIQHGGYEGYVEEQPLYEEMEYITSDVYLTWGWRKISNKKNFKRTKFLPLPSPWLSERKEYFKKFLMKTNSKAPKILYMTSKLTSFRSSPYGKNNTVMSDQKISIKIFYEILNILNKNKYKTDCKFFDIESYHGYNKFINFQNNNFKFIKFLKNFNKGLEPKLLLEYDLILWDLPGTGFLECIACDIPTILFNDQSVMKHNHFSQIFFKELENVGVFCKSFLDLKNCLSNFFLNKNVWFECNQRKKAIKKFKNEYARVDTNWWEVWRKELKDLSQ